MTFVKKELLAIPAGYCPEIADPPKNSQLIMTAKLVNYHREKLLVATFFDRKTGGVYCRIFCHRTRHISYIEGANEWRSCSIDELKAPRKYKGYSYSVSLIYVTVIADDKSARVGERYFHNGQRDTLEAIRVYQTALRTAKTRARAEERADVKNRIMARFPPLPNVEAAILDGPLRDSRYLFYRRGKARDPLTDMSETCYFGYCTHCKRESRLDWMPMHKEENRRCPACGSIVQTRAAGLSRGKLIDKCSYLVFGKSAAGEVFAWYLGVTRDYSGAFEKVTTQLRERERYYFANGEAHKFSRTNSYYDGTEKDDWIKRDCVTEPQADGCMYNLRMDYTVHPFAPNFFDGTCLRHAHFYDYLVAATKALPEDQRRDPLRIGWNQHPMAYLREYTRHPAIEHLLSAGLYPIISDYLSYSHFAQGLIDWSKTRPRDMLGLPQPEIELISSAQLDACALGYYKRIRAELGRLPDAEDVKFVCEMCAYAMGRLEDMLKDGDAAKTIAYFRRQRRRSPDRDYRELYISFEDYHRECYQLGYDLARDDIRYPHDLGKAHQKTMELIRQQERIEAAKKNAAERKKFAARLKALEAYTYEDADAGLVIRAARSRQELVEEGADLSHCIGGYATRHLEGNTTLFFIRRLSAPEKSYFTLEFWGGKIQQNRGLKNCAPPKDVTQFAQRWLENIALPIYEKEQRKKNRNRVKVPVAAIA